MLSVTWNDEVGEGVCYVVEFRVSSFGRYQCPRLDEIRTCPITLLGSSFVSWLYKEYNGGADAAHRDGLTVTVVGTTKEYMFFLLHTVTLVEMDSNLDHPHLVSYIMPYAYQDPQTGQLCDR